jgi:hypothetical protein
MSQGVYILSWILLLQSLMTPLVFAQVNNQSLAQPVTVTQDSHPTALPTPKRVSLESGFITHEDTKPYNSYANFNPSCPAIIPLIREENKSVPTSGVFDWFIDWWTKSKAASAISTCSVPQEGFISDCKDEETKTFYKVVQSQTGFESLPLTEFFEDYVSNRKETFIVGYNHAPPSFTSVDKCLKGLKSDAQNLMLTYAEYISNLTRLKRGALLSLEQLANVDRMLSINTEMGTPVLKEINCGRPETKVTGSENIIITAGPSTFAEEQKWCDKLTSCKVPKQDTAKQLTTLIKNTEQFYKDLKFLYIQKSIYSAARTLLMKNSDFLNNTGVNSCGLSSDGLAGFGNKEGMKSQYYPYNIFAEYMSEAYSKESQTKKTQAETLNMIWEDFEPDLSGEESPSRINSSIVYLKPKGVGFKIIEGEWSRPDNIVHAYTVFNETFFNSNMNECINNFSINPSPTDKDAKAFKTIQDFVSKIETDIKTLKNTAQANMPWIFAPEFIDIEKYSHEFFTYLFSPDPSEAGIRKMFINKFKSDRNGLISALSDYRRAARCMTSSGYAESTCEDLNDIIERIPYFNPLSLTKVDLKGPGCFIGAYGYVQGYFGAVECARHIKKYNKQYDQIAWDSTKAIGFTIATAGLSGIAMAGRLMQAAIAGSRAAHLTRLGAGIAALGLDGYMGGVGVNHAYDICQGPIESYGVATNNIDLADFDSGPQCPIALDRAGNNVNNLKQQAGSCVGAAVMSLTLDLLPIIPSIGLLGAIKRANTSKLEDLARATDVKAAPGRTLTGEDIPGSPSNQSTAEIAGTKPPDAPAPGGQTVSTQPDGAVAPAVGRPNEARLNDPATGRRIVEPRTRELSFENSISDAPLPAHRQGAVGDISKKIDATTDVVELKELRAQRGRAMDDLSPELERQARMDLADELIGFRKGKTASEIDAIETELMRLHHEIQLPPKPDPFLPKNHPDVIAYEKAYQTALRNKMKGAKAAGITDQADRELLVKNWILGSQDSQVDSLFHVPSLPTHLPNVTTLPLIQSTVIRLGNTGDHLALENILKAHVPPRAVKIRPDGKGVEIDLSQISDPQKRQFLSGMLVQQRKTDQLRREMETLTSDPFSDYYQRERIELALAEAEAIEKEMKAVFIDRMKGTYSLPAQTVSSLKGPERSYFTTDSLRDFEIKTGHKSPQAASLGWNRIELSTSAVGRKGATGKRVIYRHQNGRISVAETFTPDGQYLGTEVIVQRNPSNPSEGHAFFAFEEGRLSDKFKIPGNKTHKNVSHNCSGCHRNNDTGLTSLIPIGQQSRFLDEYIQSLQ